jgi:hypothetical protein
MPTKFSLCTTNDISGYIAGIDFEEAGEKWRAGDAAKVGTINCSSHAPPF